jgi:hypothetical protein
MAIKQLLRLALFAIAMLGFGQIAVYAQDAEGEPGMEAAPAEAPAGEEAPVAGDMPMEEAPAEAPAAPPAGNAPGVDAAKLGDDPAVRALMESKPTTPAELFRIAYLLVELQRADAALPLVKQFIASNPTPRDLSNILREHGSARLWRLARAEALGADGKKMIDMVLDGSRAYSRDPQRMAELVKHLNHPAPEVRRAAIHDLSAAEGDAVAVLIAALANAELQAQHTGVRDALVAMGKTSIPPLVAAVAADDASVAIQAIECLGRIKDREALDYLFGPALGQDAARRNAAMAAIASISGRKPAPQEIEKLLAKVAAAYLARSVRLPTHGSDEVVIWKWDATKREVVPQSMHHDDALAAIAARLAGELALATPQNMEHLRLFILASLESAKLTAGLDTPLAKVPEVDPAMYDSVLAKALAERRSAAAIGAAEALGKLGDAELLVKSYGGASTLVEAARSHDRRVRFAAVSAIMQIAPTKPYAGSSSVLEALCYFAASDGRSKALVVDPKGYRAQTLAGFTDAIGFDGDAAIVGRGGRFLLNQSADYEFVLIDLGVDHPQVYDLLGELRRDPRTAHLPIGIMAGDGLLQRAKRLSAAFPRSIAFPQATDVETIQQQAGHLLALQGRHAVSPDVRQRQAELALAWLAKISAQPHAVYDLSRCESTVANALLSPNHSAAAAEFLANLGTHTAQRSLVDLASQTSRPIAMRQQAAAAFAKSVPLRGIQLTSDEIVRQYDRYNASRTLNEATQKVLGSILDTIEAPREAASKKQPAAKSASLER